MCPCHFACLGNRFIALVLPTKLCLGNSTFLGDLENTSLHSRLSQRRLMSLDMVELEVSCLFK